MKKVLLTSMCLLAMASVAMPQEVTARDDGKLHLTTCAIVSEIDRSWCKAEQVRFVNLYRRSLEKDYHSQKSVASCLFGGCDGAVIVNKRQACAWRLLILESGYTFVDSTDQSNRRYDCVGLDNDADRLAVRSEAETLMRRIYDKPIPSVR